MARFGKKGYEPAGEASAAAQGEEAPGRADAPHKRRTHRMAKRGGRRKGKRS